MANQTSSVYLQISKAFKANLLPGMYLQIFAVALAVSYFYWPQSRFVFDFLGNTKLHFGGLYAIVSTSIFGGLLPFLVIWLSGQLVGSAIKNLFFYVLLWAFMGGLIDHFYQFQSALFGQQVSILTVAKKTAFDQFVFSVLITCPLLAFVYLWRDHQFDWVQTKQHINRQFFYVQFPATVITNWLIWIPAVSVIYTMPANLQIPFFNLVLCFFVLILTVLNTRQNLND